VHACRQSDAQVSIEFKREGYDSIENLTLETAKSPHYIVCRCRSCCKPQVGLQQLRIRENHNCRARFVGAWGKRYRSGLNGSLSCYVHPPRGDGVCCKSSFLESDKLMFMIDIFFILRIL